ncbi:MULTISPECIES: OmpH family outer membrane protein [Mesonia]|uniref:Outer membrane p25 n=1 Tax=Mesonia oceanica TaxID=2687242 RepID=A0AC61Y8B7_9FLAO|nr:MULTISPECIES: OmpH family outer membrane protein [Mesonia]MAN27395.1 hypothetical protein [Mesonia sp.]MAQ40330.1 hypothetical protein [Mesonia sp.]MBJ97241.1 hypothetical protein [Flavobacteriaceae bacterium]VVV00762.1 Outer membrane p25 [Mesonia oceanica]|tara:strand:- start:483 stop:1325 length:843 start_codon:yes stop_codon:yes gene_type:complete
MKKRFLFVCLLFLSSLAITAQRGIKMAYIDMDYILKNVPEYQEASQQLEARVQKWRSEIQKKMQNVEDMKQDLSNERALLTKELIEEREEEIAYEEQAILEYQEEKFGPQGAFIVQKRQLVQPVQDQIFNAVQEIGEKRQYDFIFENSADALLLFSAKRHDISDQVLNIIQRSSRKLDLEDRRKQKEEEENSKIEEPYKSVEQAAEDKEEAAERDAIRQAKEDEREQMLNERQQRRDSIRAARQKEFEERRAKLLEARERRRDSLEKLRNQKNNTTPPGR